MSPESTARQRIRQEAKTAVPRVGRGHCGPCLGMGLRMARSQINVNQQHTLLGAFQVPRYLFITDLSVGHPAFP